MISVIAFSTIVSIFFGISFTVLSLNYVTNKDYDAHYVEATPRVGFLSGICGGFQIALLGTLGFVYIVGTLYPDSNDVINGGVIGNLLGGFLTPFITLFLPRN